MFYLAFSLWVLSLAAASHAVTFQEVDGSPGISDNGTFGPPVEIVHLFQHPPIGIAVSKSGRAFVTFNRGNITTNPNTLVEIVNSTSDAAWPNAAMNTPPNGLFNASSGINYASSDSSTFLNVQGVLIDALDRLWVLDTGRPANDGGDNAPSFPGGPKLMAFDLTETGGGAANSSGTNSSSSSSTNGTFSDVTPFMTITFPNTVLPATAYMNDFRIDLSKGDAGIAYIADSGAHGIIVVDLSTGESWRHLDQMASVSPKPGFLPTLFGIPTYQSSAGSPAYHYITAAGGGIDGFTLSADGAYVYFSPIASRDLYRVPTEPLRANPSHDVTATVKAASAVQFLGEMGGAADGFETDSTGKIYLTSTEHNAVNTYDPNTGLIEPFVRDPRLAWPDTLAVADDGYMYITLPQLWLGAAFQNGTDKRVKPFALARVPVEGSPVRLV
ncbi:major royal jelly protein-domain-containing protein [Schizophyllum amplum]|uniref:Major royal jelly protein-domain-containing protein n=1 Tax=Schizophyllum amplum TaxID=97359 RepID=A0A550CPQ9_9AGAR|nr:major royal jelly protein-domain-containing protein [Auriculariopsis ampla]